MSRSQEMALAVTAGQLTLAQAAQKLVEDWTIPTSAIHGVGVPILSVAAWEAGKAIHKRLKPPAAVNKRVANITVPGPFADQFA